MPAALSKEPVASADADAAAAKKKRILKAIKLSVFQSVCQHVVTLQSEPMLVRQLCGGDVSLMAKNLANTAGLVGALGLVVNQAGGKLSDCVGRKPGILIGPMGNIILGLVVYAKHTNMKVVLFCRVLRMIITTFSNTVITQAMLQDFMTGRDFGIAMSEVGAVIGAAVVVTPILETFILQRFKHTKYSYLTLAAMAAMQLTSNMINVPETLDVSKRITMDKVLVPATFNPFGFMQIFTRGSKAVQFQVLIQTFQMFLEGKNMSDMSEIWKREHLKFSTEGSRNYVVLYGMCCIVSAAAIGPKLLRENSVRGYTTICNLLNLAGFLLRGVTENIPLFLTAAAIGLPGVNGASANALKTVCNSRAAAEKLAMGGEFSAWTNNLRAIAGALAPLVYGNSYAMARKAGLLPGTPWILGGLIGAALPQLLLTAMPDEDLEAVKPPPPPADAGKKEGALQAKA